MSDDVLVIIPARYASTRFPGKPLVALAGAHGERKSLIRRCWDAAQRANGVSRIVVATDDPRISEHAAAFGAEIAMTGPGVRNGTERCAEAFSTLASAADLVINLQGDAPLTPPDFIEALIRAMKAHSEDAMATPVLRCDAETLGRFREDRAAGRVGGTTAVFDRAGRALYFSKEVVPYSDALATDASPAVFHHVGLYAYRPEALTAYSSWTPGPLETIEGLEQLRFLENGVSVRCVEVEARGRPFWEVNNPIDVERVERALSALGMD
jgi:3-deoxy-manno-octulosonate cytidylyltransferase (CMP-KDO synthetase)